MDTKAPKSAHFLHLDQITLQDGTDSRYQLELFQGNQKIDLQADGNRTWTPVQHSDISPTSKMRVEIQRITGHLFWKKNRPANEEIDLQGLYDDYWSSKKHEFIIRRVVDVGKHQVPLDLRFFANVTAESLHSSLPDPEESTLPLPSRFYGLTVTNDAQLEDLCKQGEVALQKADIQPPDPIVLHDANWNRAREALCALISAGKIGPTEVDDKLIVFVWRVGRSRSFQCRVPVQSPDGTTIYCEHQVQRKDRILRHVKDVHLGYRPFVCGGQCGTVSCDYTAADPGYLDVHIHPHMVTCELCKKELHRLNLKDHQKICGG